MTVIDELKYYCKEKEPVGAVLLTGEWGCGKTYLIEHELKKDLSEQAIVIRISLFGISSLEMFELTVKRAWAEAYLEEAGAKKITQKIRNIKMVISKFGFLSEKIEGLSSINASDFFIIRNKINNKSVVFVFDDLERCAINIVEILGAINEYCENKKYHTIIIGNEEKIKENDLFFMADLTFVSKENTNVDLNGQTAELKISKGPNFKEDEISYSKIKEKIIYKTIKYIPDYSNIINSIIHSMEHGDAKYKDFIKSNGDSIVELFSPKSCEEKALNIRSLKSAINDFYRVFEELTRNEENEPEKWLYSFIAYVISFKAGEIKSNLVKDSIYEGVSSKRIFEQYPMFQKEYIFDSVKKWVSDGVWDDNAIKHEIELLNKRRKAIDPKEIIKNCSIQNIDECVIEKGFEEFLNVAYDGELTLDEYIRFIQNCAWARQDGFEFPKQIDWEKIKCGIKKQIKIVESDLPEGQLTYTFIENTEEEFFEKEENETYNLILNFTSGDEYMFFRNREQYKEKVANQKGKAFLELENKRYDVFDEEMANITAKAFLEENNLGKIRFLNQFLSIWQRKINSSDIKLENTISGLEWLRKLIEVSLNNYKEIAHGRTYKIIHTENYIKGIDDLIENANRIMESREASNN